MNFIHRLVNSFTGLTVPCLLFKFVLLTLIENGAFFVEINQISEKCHTSWNNMILVPPRRPSFWCFIVYYILKEPRAFFIYLLIYSLFFFCFLCNYLARLLRSVACKECHTQRDGGHERGRSDALFPAITQTF